MVPDIIIEVTKTCNKKCHGCYAANTVIKGQFSEDADQNLAPENLHKALDNLPSSVAANINVAFLRGGEPFTNPMLYQIVDLLFQRNIKSVIETNGDFIFDSPKVLSSVAESNSVLKISFDSMHKSNPDILQKQINFLQEKNIPYLVAITTSNLEQFEHWVSKILFVPRTNIIYQKMATSAETLVKPKFGVINFQALARKGVSTKWEKDFSTL